MQKIKHLFKEYYDQDLNDSEIGRLLNCNNATVTMWRNENKLESHFLKNNIDKRNRKYLSKIKVYPEITGECLSFITGTLLGDASINNQNHFSYTHKIAQRNYANLKYNLIGLNATYSERNYYLEDNPFLHCCYSYKAHPLFKRLRKVFYPKDKKIFPLEHCSKYLTWKSFAFWFIDDGCKSSSGGLTIAAHNFSNQLNKIQNILEQNLSLSSTIHGGNTLYFAKDKKDYISENIFPYIDECVYYKLRSQ